MTNYEALYSEMSEAFYAAMELVAHEYDLCEDLQDINDAWDMEKQALDEELLEYLRQLRQGEDGKGARFTEKRVLTDHRYLYHKLVLASEKVIDLLIRAQQKCEDMYIGDEDYDPAKDPSEQELSRFL